MNKFVFISFVFMGWAFFELSGGMDFKPRVNPALSVAVSTPLVTPQPVEPVEILTTALIPPPSSMPPSSMPATIRAVVPDRTAPDVAKIQTVDLTVTPAVMLASLEQGGEGFGGLLEGFDPTAIRLSVAATSDFAEPEPDLFAEPELPPADLRTISGTRVNMRNGPGTIYDVIIRLTLGQEVEVLDDSGSGWLRLRLVSDRTVGWISASLVSKPQR